VTEPSASLRARFGDIDIYLFDQLLRGRIAKGMRVLDAGCGSGRNLIFLAREGFDIWAIDEFPEAVEASRRVVSELLPALPADRFRAEAVENLSLPAESIDVVISSAVLHFARDEAHWTAMVDSMWRVLAPGGLLFARLASTIGQEGKLRSLGAGQYVMPDGSTRYLIDDTTLIEHTTRLGGRLLDPIKTSVVHDTRSMATWVVAKPR
jgi:2-polyprenyl-3-methyl-5-hydroxy-6-metoxy-1,4-benzoquinol methylase